MEITIIYNDESQIKQINSEILENYKVNFLDIQSKKTKKKAWKIKNYCSAKLDPFIVITNKDNKIIKAFYSEAENVINSLNNLLKNYGKENNCKCD